MATRRRLFSSSKLGVVGSISSTMNTTGMVKGTRRIGALAFSALAAVWAAEPENSAAISSVQLPTYVVTETREVPPPESWRHAEIPGFEVLSNASDAQTRDFLSELQLFHQAIKIVWPAIHSTLPPSS